MKEFDPRTERHYPLFIVKAVEPGCTTEWQIELAASGKVIRGTTTDNADEDEVNFIANVTDAARQAWHDYCSTSPECGTTALED